MAITVIGSVAVDNIETPFEKKQNILGGSASFFSVASSYLTDVNIIAVVGNDFDDKYIDILKSKNINVDNIIKKHGKTFHWEGKYDYDMSDPQTLNTELGVFLDFKPSVPHIFKNDTLFLANIDPDIQLEVLEQMLSPKLIALDTMNFWIEKKKDKLLQVIKKSDIFMINESEARLLTGQASIFSAAKKIFEYGAKIIVLKRGSYGATLFTDKIFFMIPAYPLENVVDPTGAGDSFAGGFLGYIDNTGNLNNENLKKALVFGNIMASFAVESFSIEKLLSIDGDKIKDRFAKFRNMTYFENI
jgi:sugar/nucleoside kinase (ribokinase family)